MKGTKVHQERKRSSSSSSSGWENIKGRESRFGHGRLLFFPSFQPTWLIHKGPFRNRETVYIDTLTTSHYYTMYLYVCVCVWSLLYTYIYVCVCVQYIYSDDRHQHSCVCAVLLLRVRLGEARARVNELSALSLSPSTSSSYILFVWCVLLLFLCLTAPLLNAIINSIFRERTATAAAAVRENK